MRKLFLISALCLAIASCGNSPKKETKNFPYVMPKEKPDFQLSKSMNNVYDRYGAATPQANELYTQFKYTQLEGLDNRNNDGTITRRDPSRIVKVGDTYYVWYTLRNTKSICKGADLANDTIPSADWDLSDIGYATSKDGFTWTEQGVAVARPAKPNPGWRSVSTPDVLVWKGKYYLYYQAFSEISGKRGDDCPVACSWADSPDGPWHATNEVVVPNGPEGTWDQFSIHDPQPIVYKGKIYLYYKSDYNMKSDWIRSQGLAISDNPLGPFVKYEHNPVISSGHETELFRFKEGIAAILAKDGHEANTIQYSPDGINFDIASIVEMPPIAAGIYDPDAFTDTEYARGITWGLSHLNAWGPTRSFLLRFDCDLSLDINDPIMKKNVGIYDSIQEIFRRGLTTKQKADIIKRMQE